MKSKKIIIISVILVLVVLSLSGCKADSSFSDASENKEMVESIVDKKWLAKSIHLEIHYMNGDYMENEIVFNNEDRTKKSRVKIGKNAKYEDFTDSSPFNVRVEEFNDNNRLTMKTYHAMDDKELLSTHVYEYEIRGDKISIKLLPDESETTYNDPIELHGVLADISVSESEFSTITTIDKKFFKAIGDENIDGIEKMIVTATRVLQE